MHHDSPFLRRNNSNLNTVESVPGIGNNLHHWLSDCLLLSKENKNQTNICMEIWGVTPSSETWACPEMDTVPYRSTCIHRFNLMKRPFTINNSPTLVTQPKRKEGIKHRRKYFLKKFLVEWKFLLLESPYFVPPLANVSPFQHLLILPIM